MATTRLYISINRENDGSVSVCKSLRDTEESEVIELRDGHGDIAKLLKFVTVEVQDSNTARAIDALAALIDVGGDAPGSPSSVFDHLLNVVFDLGREFPK